MHTSLPFIATFLAYDLIIVAHQCRYTLEFEESKPEEYRVARSKMDWLHEDALAEELQGGLTMEGSEGKSGSDFYLPHAGWDGSCSVVKLIREDELEVST